MKCPNCNDTLLMTERHSVEIDYCPNCRGVWLDKGELDKLLQFASAQRPDASGSMESNTYRANNYDNYENQHKNKTYQGKPHKKKSFLSDFFDFD